MDANSSTASAGSRTTSSSTGVGPGSSVAIMLPNRPEFIETNAAAMRVGATVSFVNPRAPAADAKRHLRAHEGRRRRHAPRRPRGRTPSCASATTTRARSRRRPRPSRSSTGSAQSKVVVFTSGTTGRPKGAVRSLEQSASLGSLVGFLRTIPYKTSDVHMVVCPLYHSSGSGFATVAQGLGNTMVIVEKFSPEAFCRNVQKHKVTTTTVVPTMLHQIASWPEAKNYDLSSLRIVVCTGSPLREEVREGGARAARQRDLRPLRVDRDGLGVDRDAGRPAERSPARSASPSRGSTSASSDPDGNRAPAGRARRGVGAVVARHGGVHGRPRPRRRAHARRLHLREATSASSTRTATCTSSTARTT